MAALLQICASPILIGSVFFNLLRSCAIILEEFIGVLIELKQLCTIVIYQLSWHSNQWHSVVGTQIDMIAIRFCDQEISA